MELLFAPRRQHVKAVH